MKKIIFTISILFYTLYGYSQEFTIEYNIGYGMYKLSDLKDMLDKVRPPLNNVEKTDNFPGYLINDIRFGFNYHQHQMGILGGYQNTAGQKQVADYSGEYKFRIRANGFKLGSYYRYVFIHQAKVSPYLEISAGSVLSNIRIKEQIKIGDEQRTDEVKLNGANMFIQPAVGVRYRFNQFASVNFNAGYEFDPIKKLHLKGEPQNKSNIKADWSGIRINLGIVTYIKIN